MMPRPTLTIEISPRELPFGLCGVGYIAQGLWTKAPLVVAVPVALLMSVRVSVRPWWRRPF